MSSDGRYPVFFEGNAMVVSTKEREFLEYFIGCGDVEEAGLKAGMSMERVKEFMASDRIKRYIASKIEQTGRRNDITLDTVLDRLHKVAWGELKVSKFEMKALEILASYLGILKPSVQVAVGVQIDRPLAALPDDKIESMMAERIGVTKQIAE